MVSTDTFDFSKSFIDFVVIIVCWKKICWPRQINFSSLVPGYQVLETLSNSLLIAKIRGYWNNIPDNSGFWLKNLQLCLCAPGTSSSDISIFFSLISGLTIRTAVTFKPRWWIMYVHGHEWKFLEAKVIGLELVCIALIKHVNYSRADLKSKRLFSKRLKTVFEWLNFLRFPLDMVDTHIYDHNTSAKQDVFSWCLHLQLFFREKAKLTHTAYACIQTGNATLIEIWDSSL
jgi:hypothetical protein